VLFTNSLFSFENDHVIAKIVAIATVSLNTNQVNGLAIGHDQVINDMNNMIAPRKSGAAIKITTHAAIKLPI
jgi:hypothetical protein